MTLTELALASTIIGGLAATSTGGIDSLAGDARHAVNQQLSASITKASEMQYLLNLNPKGSSTPVELAFKYPAASEAGIVETLQLHLVDYEIVIDDGYVSFYTPAAPRNGNCEIRYHQATEKSEALIELRSSSANCVHKSDRKLSKSGA